MNQENKVVKISDVVQNQIPEFILSENPNFEEFLKQYYISQEFQGSNVDLAENLISYKNLDSFDLTNLISEATLSSDVGYFDDVIDVSSTAGWPQEYGLLKIDDEIITYTGITSTSFTGCIRGFSGISSLTQQNNPEFLVFSQTESTTHTNNTPVQNLSNLFLKEFFKKIKYQFTPGFEELNFTPEINPQNFISKVKSFYQTKGTDEAFKILFKVLYAQNVKVLKPNDYCFTPSDDKWRIVETFVCELVSGNPFNINGQTLYQDNFPQYNITNANGSIYKVETFLINGNTYYKIQIFSGYSNNLNPKGSIEGTFVPTPKTFVVEDIASGSTIITVDSTIGFANSGTLEINGLIVKYTDKTNNQFLNCSGVTSNIARKTKVFLDHYVYAYEENTENIVKFKLDNVLSKLESSDVLYAYDGDPIQIDHLGSTEDSVLLNSLVYNIPVSILSGYSVQSITPQIRNNQKEAFSVSNGLALCQYPHYLKTGDVVDLYILNSNQLVASNLSVSVVDLKEFTVSTLAISQQYGNINDLIGKQVLFRRRVKKSQYLNIDLTANIQNSYVDSKYYYLTSNGLPEYQINPITYYGNFVVIGTHTLLTNVPQHFKTGEKVTITSWEASPEFKNEIGIATGKTYYITSGNEFVAYLSEDKQNLKNSSYLSFTEYDSLGNPTATVTKINVVADSDYNKTFNSSKIFKKFNKLPILSEKKEATNPGNIGIFINGIELRNFKSFDKIYYGPIDSITVLNPGSGYDLNNPPKFEVVNGPNTNIIPQLKGKLTKILVTDPGFDYVEVPTVKVLGGNNFESISEVKLKNIINQVDFNATTLDTVVDTVNNTFNFKTKHRFVTGEPILYKTLGTRPVGIGTALSDGYLEDNSVYYAVNVGAGTSMSLAFSKKDAFSGQNIINLRTYGGGFQSFVSTVPKKGIDEINILQDGGTFEYKKLSFIASDVNILDNIITIKDHGFSTGEEVLYTWIPLTGFVGATIGGLVNNNYYYIVKIDENRIKLSSTKNSINYIDFSSVESYTSYFLEYSPIRVELSGTLTTKGTSQIGYDATIVPLVEGFVTNATIEKFPDNVYDTFGHNDIVNYEDDPEINLIKGSGASFEPIIVNGKITQVIVKSSGSGYYNAFSLIVKGDGFGAKLEPVISQGKIINVTIVSSGINYSSKNTKIEIAFTGINVKLKANITSYTLNKVSQIGYSNIEDGEVSGKNYSLTGTSYGVYFLNTKLRNFLNIPTTPVSHSSIIGWSYDGCPIYGPYGYANIDGTGGIIRMQSGYVYQNNISSPFELVENYVFTNNGTLDKYNGRFCVTPEYPNGVYAYFCTLDNNNIPVFPYVIGPQYNYYPVEDNFDLRINQTSNFNNLNIIKWTKPYRVEDVKTKYEYFEFFENGNQKDIIVTKSSSGFVDEIKVIEGGLNYQVGDSLVFDDEGTSGFGAIAKVSEVSGIGITSIITQTTIIPNITFISDGVNVTGITTTSHSLKDNSYINISGISTNSSNLSEGFYKINVQNISTKLIADIGSSSTTGLTTSIQVAELLTTFEVDSNLEINGEILTVVGLDYKNNLVNVLRSPGSPSHIKFEVVNLLPNKFKFSTNQPTLKYDVVNESYYFNSLQSVSIGSSTGPGIGNSLTIYPLGLGVSYTKYVQTGGIYLPNNKFNTGDKIKYTPGTSTIITNYGSLNSFPNLYVIKLDTDVIGIVTSKSNVSDPNKIITYNSAGTGDLHKFTTDRNIITGTGTENNCVVSTASTHGLSVGNIVKLNTTSGVTTSFAVTYSNSRVLINSQINPKLDVYSNDIVTFDLSDPSLIGKTFNLYSDSNFLNPYFGNVNNGIEVEKTSTTLTLNISKYTPKNLFYNLDASDVDITVSDYNQLKISNSKYNIDSIVTSATDNTFELNLNDIPERNSYNNVSLLSYTVLSPGVLGSIHNVEILSRGSGYKKLPQISSVISNSGIGCNLFADSYSIGKIEDTKVVNTQFICPTDKTLEPSSNVFSVLKLTDNYTVDNITVLYGGKNYVSEPTIQLYNLKENKIVSNFSAVASLKNASVDNVSIINPGYGLKSSDNQIVVINNTNGFNIIDVLVTGTSSPYTVNLTLKTPLSGFTTSNPLPISIGDEIFVEGIYQNGFNSSNYNYQPFIVTFVDPAYGSQDAAVIRYQVKENPGLYDSGASYNANVIPYSYIPKIEIKLKQNSFYNKEFVDNTEIIDNVNNSPILDIVKVKTSKFVKNNDIIIGKSSKSQGKIVEVNNFNSTFATSYGVEEILGGTENRGYLSSNIQKLSDNDYYQKFSYSLKSKEQFEDWNSPVSDISHISGYKKFSDLSVESVGIGTTQSIKTNSTSTLNVLLDSYVDVNSISNYDLVNEIDVEDNNRVYTQYLKFHRLKLGQSLKSTDNRVLSVDDISNLFTNSPIIPSVIVDTSLSSETTTLKYEFYLTATKSFIGNFIYPEIFEVLVSRTGDTINLTSYSYYNDYQNLGSNALLGNFTAAVNPLNNNEVILSFVPTNQFVSVDIRAIKEIAPVSVGIATTTFGYVRNVEICAQYDGTQTSSPQTIYSIPTSVCNSGTVIIGISSIKNNVELSFESSFVNISTDVLTSTYSIGSYSDLGSFDIVKNGSNIDFVYTGNAGIGVTVQANLKFLTNIYAGYSTIQKTLTQYRSSQVTSNSLQIPVSTISGSYGYTKYIIEIDQTIGTTTQRSIVQINSLHVGSGSYLSDIIYNLSGSISLDDLNFQTNYNFVGNTYTLYFSPITPASYTLTVYESSLLSPN